MSQPAPATPTVMIWPESGPQAPRTGAEPFLQDVTAELPRGDRSVAVAAMDARIVSACDMAAPSAEPAFSRRGTGPDLTGGLAAVQEATRNAGLEPRGTIGGFAFLDATRDGQQVGDASLPGVAVTLFDGLGQEVGTTATDAEGRYGFSGLPPGTYAVQVTAPSGHRPSPRDVGPDATDSDVNSGGGSALVTLAAGRPARVDAGFFQPVSVRGAAFLDTDGDGSQFGEPGFGEVTVQLYAGQTLLGTAETDESGHYAFGGLNPGAYGVRFLRPAGYVRTDRDAATDDLDSDANPANGRTDTVLLASGESAVLDAGFCRAVSVTGRAPAGRDGTMPGEPSPSGGPGAHELAGRALPDGFHWIVPVGSAMDALGEGHTPTVLPVAPGPYLAADTSLPGGTAAHAIAGVPQAGFTTGMYEGPSDADRDATAGLSMLAQGASLPGAFDLML